MSTTLTLRGLPTSGHTESGEASKQGHRDIEFDVLRDRTFDVRDKFLPDCLSNAADLDLLTEREQRVMSHVQGRTYVNLLALLTRRDGKTRHQELFRRVEALIARAMPNGYHVVAGPNDIANAARSRSRWAQLALTRHLQLCVQRHYEHCIAGDVAISPLFRDICRYHWQEESQYAVLDRLEWRGEHGRLSPQERERGALELAELIAVMDKIARKQAAADADYFLWLCERRFSRNERQGVRDLIQRAYHSQYLASGLELSPSGSFRGPFGEPHLRGEQDLAAAAPVGDR